MSSTLKLTIGQHTDKGRKETNQDFHGALLPPEPQLGAKGAAIALADGISSSDVAHVASAFAVRGFLDDYYCTSDAWSVKTSALRVLGATNSWLHSQTQQGQGRYNKDHGHVCTFSALVIKSTTAHILHVGDGRITLLRGGKFEQLTNDHRIVVSEGKSYLSRALGIHPQLDIDYRSLPVESGDVFVLATDGVYEHVDQDFIRQTLDGAGDDLDAAAATIVAAAFRNGSPDNLTLQLVRVDALPEQRIEEIHQQLAELPLPPLLQPRAEFDGYTIVREIHGSSRSHLYLATDNDSGEKVVIKIPSVDLANDPGHLEAFLMEEWIARRIDSIHVLKPGTQTRKRNFLYVVTEYIEGQTLAQWMRDNPAPELETVRELIEQIARGLQAFHRLEMLHQDLRPENILIDRAGTLKLIDFGSVRVAGVAEAVLPAERSTMLGTLQYAAPEYFLWEEGSTRSDLFSLGVIAYQLLSGRLPYGAEVAKCKTAAEQKRLKYASLLEGRNDVPVWVDGAIKKAVHPNPEWRHDELSEFIYDLRHPNRAFLSTRAPPLIERNPLVFWKSLSLGLALVLIVLLATHPWIRS
ncbi:MAG: bifunctional protein-serine/threonine kinase/phosphatase [Gammaproteobacteria bacterium]|nr:bifunctional protein-serine/threonine kinase/phosphatase [Gammaproteobacteria bacterium]MBU1644879.1 bifunctional protein-serine/threonine kinase/phosphatase [Gammaproteobacteria bacterium]MBU1971338.1 bifunctional protein-serine/threonine kinase/phosphatase [Gammaproteobacteria bacterium]